MFHDWNVEKRGVYGGFGKIKRRKFSMHRNKKWSGWLLPQIQMQSKGMMNLKAFDTKNEGRY